jgi:hypothetical protein
MDYPEITFTMTTCRRLELFKRTMESFRKTCRDQDLIKHWIISDDGSSESDIEEMRRLCPEFTILQSPGRGQAKNLNNLFAAVKTEWFFGCEDDWLFLKEDNYIRKMLDVAFDDERIKNVTLRHWEGGYEVKSKKDLEFHYNLHWFSQFDHGNMPIESVQILCEKTNCNWFGYTLNPGLQHLPTVKRLGAYETWTKPLGYGRMGLEDDRCFDRPQAIKYLTMGLRTACLMGKYIEHIGDGRSAYAAN